MPRKVVLATVGSLGDLHPFIALGVALRERGVNAVIACAEDYRGKVEAAGVAFHALRPGFDEMQRDLGMSRAQLTRGVVAHSAFMFRKLVLPYVRSAFEDMMAVTADADLILPSSLAFAARLAAEKRGIPWIAVVLQPMMFLSSYDPPVISEAESFSTLLRALGPAPTRYALWILKKALNGLFRPLHALRADLGLAPSAQNPLFDGQFSHAGAIGLYSSLLGEIQPDYPQPTSIVGFATFDSEDGRRAGLHPALEAFLNAGPPPLVFTLGSLIVNSPGNFYAQGALAARIIGRRAVLLVGEEAYDDFAHLQSPEVFVVRLCAAFAAVPARRCGDPSRWHRHSGARLALRAAAADRAAFRRPARQRRQSPAPRRGADTAPAALLVPQPPSRDLERLLGDDRGLARGAPSRRIGVGRGRCGAGRAHCSRHARTLKAKMTPALDTGRCPALDMDQGASMKLLNRAAAAAVLALSIGAPLRAAAAPAAGAPTWTEGVNYFLITPPHPTSLPAGKVEVTEVFSYACPACNLFVPTIHKLKASLAAQCGARLPAGLLQSS